jgi:phosphohistidine swiveling domain-containing protein
VHLVFNIENADLLQVGQILTTTMTNPDMVPSMQRSAAVVTDVGGMICHAAIVSRELGIPCVVGTKYATQTLPAGSLVTVDGSAGLIFRGLVESQGDALPARKLHWSDLWRDWQAAVSAAMIPLLSTYRALADMPPSISRCVLDPFSDLVLDARAEISSLASLAEASRNELLRSYAERLAGAVDQRGLQALFLDMRRLDEAIQKQFISIVAQGARVYPLQDHAARGPWHIQLAPDGEPFALLDKLTPEALQAAPQDAIVTIPLGFGRLIVSGPGRLPEASQGPGGVFGMMPEVRMARMPGPEHREAMHRLVPMLSQAHGGQVPTSDQAFPWLDLRSEVLITPFLKAFVTPGVEAIPYALGFDDPPLHVQFIRCRFHFRQDTLFGFLPKFMQATWDEGFLSSMLQRCRDSYVELERLAQALPGDEEALVQAENEKLSQDFVAWWNAFTDFFTLSFFIQAQGDDCVFPALDMMAKANAALLENGRPEWQIPDMVQLSAPVTPVLTAEYMQDLLALKQALQAQGVDNLTLAQQAMGLIDKPDLNTVFERVWRRWHWMRERDPYYDPYDTPAAILEKALAIRSAEPVDYDKNRSEAELALALHFDLARLMDSSEKLVYAVKYGRALAIDRENHHIVWLRASYRLRKLLLAWEGQLSQHTALQARDIFFMQPWEILAAVAAQPQPLPPELLQRIRNRRLAYEKEMRLKAGEESSLEPQPETDYY